MTGLTGVTVAGASRTLKPFVGPDVSPNGGAREKRCAGLTTMGCANDARGQSAMPGKAERAQNKSKTYKIRGAGGC